jgi:hypothetical protein
MTDHLSDEQILAYRERALPATELLDVSSHLGGCEACRSRMATPEELDRGVRGWRAALLASAAPVHLSYEELEAYVDERMEVADRGSLESHIRHCRSCAADLAELRTLRAELEAARAGSERVNRPGEFWNWLASWRGLVLAGAICALLLIAVWRVPTRQSGPLTPVDHSKLAPAGDAAAPAPGSLSLRDGQHVISVTPDGRIEGLDRLEEPERALLEQALVQKRIEAAPALVGLGANRSVLLGTADRSQQSQLVAPLATVVESPLPVFRWRPLPGAVYRVSVFDADYEVAAASGWISGTEWRASKPLRRGIRYSWQLNVRQNGAEFTVPVPPAPEARFRVLAEADETAIARAKSEWGDSHLVLGILYAHRGLLDQAQEQLEALGEQNPASDLAVSLLASIEKLRGGR